jgi:hypothetical protein
VRRSPSAVVHVRRVREVVQLDEIPKGALVLPLVIQPLREERDVIGCRCNQPVAPP